MGLSGILLAKVETTVLTTHLQYPLALPACLQPWAAPEPQTKLQHPAGPTPSNRLGPLVAPLSGYRTVSIFHLTERFSLHAYSFSGCAISEVFKLAAVYSSQASLPATHRVGFTTELRGNHGLRGMDDPNRRRRQNEPPVHQTSNPRYAIQDPSQQRRSLAGSSNGNERYRPAPLNTSPPAARGMGGSAGYSSYYQEPGANFSSANMPAAAMAYGSEYGPDSRQQTQSFGGYNTAATMMYNVPQPSAQTPVYDAQQFASRQPAAMQMMTPDVASTYFGSEAGSAGGPSLQQPTQGSSASASVYQQNPPMSYAANISNVNTMQQNPASAEVAMVEEHEYADGALEEKWVNYQRQLGTIFQEIEGGSLDSASETLLSVSGWLLTQVADLGLNLDDANLHADRIKLWDDFNHAWLALGEKQKDMMLEGLQLSRSQSIMSKATIKKMGNELVRLCDGIERHGLVDYQYGVWEEQITGIFEMCLDLYESEEVGGSGSSR
ncbi:hypothetical protein G7046_g9984 [Stylonectria norvegica]|nr:hypothetical protein G7046_g9984 [Stylonectria norvegica]